jgi:hypothetical protein
VQRRPLGRYLFLSKRTCRAKAGSYAFEGEVPVIGPAPQVSAFIFGSWRGAGNFSSQPLKLLPLSYCDRGRLQLRLDYLRNLFCSLSPAWRFSWPLGSWNSSKYMHVGVCVSPLRGFGYFVTLASQRFRAGLRCVVPDGTWEKSPGPATKSTSRRPGLQKTPMPICVVSPVRRPQHTQRRRVLGTPTMGLVLISKAFPAVLI